MLARIDSSSLRTRAVCLFACSMLVSLRGMAQAPTGPIVEEASTESINAENLEAREDTGRQAAPEGRQAIEETTITTQSEPEKLSPPAPLRNSNGQPGAEEKSQSQLNAAHTQAPQVGASSTERDTIEEQEIEPEGSADSAASQEPIDKKSKAKGELSLGGALRFNYLATTWNKLNQKRGGDFRFDTLRLNTGLRYGKLIAASEYRFYGVFGSYLKYGWIGVQFDERQSLKVGVHQVPFGLLPYASHNWFFNLGYYVGLEDDHDLGLLYEYNGGGWEIDLAYYHSDEGHFVGKSLDSARYSYDLVRVPEVVDAAGNVTRQASRQKEQHTGSLRFQKVFKSLAGKTLLGASGQFGGIFNELTERYGSRWSASAFAQHSLMGLELSGQVIRAEKSPVDAPESLEGVWMGAYDSAYRVAKDLWILQGNIAWTYDVDEEFLSSVQLYNDFNVMLKDEGATTYQNVTGALLSTRFIYTYIDFATGKNQPWIGGDWESGLAEGSVDAPWEMRFNINLGLYYTGLIPLP